jgi:molybdopterin molybdotransferase
MPEFLNLLNPSDALSLFLAHLPALQRTEVVHTRDALGRVIREQVAAPHPLPEFPRSTVDGFAVRAADTFGASESLPAYLSLVGEVPMGGTPDFQVAEGQCAVIHTGGMIPQGANAVVMLELTQATHQDEIEILKSAAVGENIIQVGEDIRRGEVVIEPGTRLRPEEIGGLVAIGVTQILVASRPRVGILSSGDEVIPPEQTPILGQVRDINGYTLKALVESAGAEPVYYGILPDSESAMFEAASVLKESCDVVVITAGSSASTRDLTSLVLNRLGTPGVLVHGVNVRPGKPTILAVCDGKAMIGLPGNPVSALVIARRFVLPVLSKLMGETTSRPPGMVEARLTINVPSQAGREDWIPVRLAWNEKGWQAEPVYGRSNLIFTLVGADGLVCIPPSTTGLAVGERVNVILF